uniref:Uncharacterized protein n=1 Tax=Physcomitrium patens TaxID=3218 RepID=A9S5K5_PHYPA|nr:hypothetical protein PHYPA_028241 [Physcomitrium patens]
MADPKPCGKKCLEFTVSKWVSKVAPLTSGQPAGSMNNTLSVTNQKTLSATVVFIVFAFASLFIIFLCGFLLQRNRLRNQRSDTTNVVVVQPKREEQEQEALNEEGKWGAGSVELVVMAGEKTPTFLAHHSLSPSTTAIQHPPRNLSTL